MARNEERFFEVRRDQTFRVTTASDEVENESLTATSKEIFQ